MLKDTYENCEAKKEKPDTLPILISTSKTILSKAKLHFEIVKIFLGLK